METGTAVKAEQLSMEQKLILKLKHTIHKPVLK
jgi:hypothetical protein